MSFAAAVDLADAGFVAVAAVVVAAVAVAAGGMVSEQTRGLVAEVQIQGREGDLVLVHVLALNASG